MNYQEATERLTALLDDDELDTLELIRSAVTALWDDMMTALEADDPEGTPPRTLRCPLCGADVYAEDPDFGFILWNPVSRREPCHCVVMNDHLNEAEKATPLFGALHGSPEYLSLSYYGDQLRRRRAELMDGKPAHFGALLFAVDHNMTPDDLHRHEQVQRIDLMLRSVEERLVAGALEPADPEGPSSYDALYSP